MGQLLLHIYAEQKSKLLQNISCSNTLGQWRVPFSFAYMEDISVFSATSTRARSPSTTRGKHKHDREPMHSDTREILHILHPSWTTTATKTPPYGMTHILIIRTIIHMPLKEYHHHHPTVTQHQHHHQLLIKESSGGETRPKQTKKKKHSPCTQDKVIQETKTPPLNPSMVVCFVPCSSPSTPRTKCAHIPHKASVPTYWL